ncbi:hypothetical protein [Corynebacterium efficiens YS-314]|uniref:Uncharacterized protein n=1 Tax=Corynebacterium efficiens (strain DSM 44549 / YS-314 / AJ 12310 / JCM 11189 / NBRC 100395) TaxID=196164 RepID=Q8FU85_COREF|nr:hypothetical protein [Corynebacterium efficiens YS-314]
MKIMPLRVEPECPQVKDTEPWWGGSGGQGVSAAPMATVQASGDIMADRTTVAEEETQKILRIRNNGSFQVGLRARSSYDSNL